MNQLKYLGYAVLVLLVGIGVYFIIKKFSQTRVVESSSSRIIDDDKHIDSMTKTESNGRMLYMSKCESCHGSFAKADGPHLILAGFEERWPDKKELFAFIRNPEEVIKRNAYARELKNRYNSMMTGSPNLTDGEIQSILDYIRWGLNH